LKLASALLVVVLAVAMLTGCGTVEKTVQEDGATTQVVGGHLVARVIDGDTFEVDGGERVRFIGINCPESDKPGGTEATDYTRDLLEGKTVKMEADVSDRDQYGRLLRYVWLDDTFINERIVAEGYAVAVQYPPDTKYATQLEQVERTAESKEAGLWAQPGVMESL